MYVEKDLGNIKQVKHWFFETTHDIDKPITRLIKTERKKMKRNDISNWKGTLTRDAVEIK